MARPTASARKFLIGDDLWEKIRCCLPERKNAHRFGGGRPRKDDRACMDAIFFVLRTGCQWEALDATGLCPHSTAHDRFQEWRAAGVFARIWRLGLRAYDAMIGIDWSFCSTDAALTKAPLGGGENRPQPHRPGQAWHETLAAV